MPSRLVAGHESVTNVATGAGVGPAEDGGKDAAEQDIAKRAGKMKGDGRRKGKDKGKGGGGRKGEAREETARAKAGSGALK